LATALYYSQEYTMATVSKIPPNESRSQQNQTKFNLPAFKELPLKPEYPPHAAWGVWGEKDELGTAVSDMSCE
jgi:hypothetical protein